MIKKNYWKKTVPGSSKVKFDNIVPVPHYVCSACGAFGGFVKPKKNQCRKCGVKMESGAKNEVKL